MKNKDNSKEIDNNKITAEQWSDIQVISETLGISFNGKTAKDADKFIEKYDKIYKE